MAFPPGPQTVSFTDSTPQEEVHAEHHVSMGAAIDDIVAYLEDLWDTPLSLGGGLRITDDDESTVINGYRGLLVLTPPASDDEVAGIVFKYPDPHETVDYGEADTILVLSDAAVTDLAPVNNLKVVASTTNAAPIKVTTTAAHGFTTGQNIRHTGTGIAQLDDKFLKITVVDTDEYTVDGTTAPGSTSAVGYAFTDGSPALRRLSDAGWGETGSFHMAIGLRGRSGQTIPTYGLWLQSVTGSAVPLVISNAPTSAWTPTPTADYVQINDARASVYRFRINAAGQTVIDPGSGATPNVVPGLTFEGDTNTGIARLVADSLQFITGGVQAMSMTSTLLSFADPMSIIAGSTTGLKIGTATTQKLGFWNATPATQQTVTGSRGGNAALASLLTKLALVGIIVDGSS